MLTFIDGFLLVCLSFVGTAAQLCLKRGSDLNKERHFLRSFFRFWVLLGIFLMALNSLAYIYILRRLPLSLVMPVTALVYVFVPVGAFFFFKEKLRVRFWFGALLIAAGIVITAV